MKLNKYRIKAFFNYYFYKVSPSLFYSNDDYREVINKLSKKKQ